MNCALLFSFFSYLLLYCLPPTCSCYSTSDVGLSITLFIIFTLTVPLHAKQTQEGRKSGIIVIIIIIIIVIIIIIIIILWERRHWGDQDVDGRIILRWIFRKLKGVVGTGWSWLRIGTGGGHLWVR